MKVLLINGSPREKSRVYTALSQAAATLQEEKVQTEIYHIGKKPIGECISCMDGFIFGTPVYYGSANSSLLSFMTRLFFPDLLTGGNIFSLKPPGVQKPVQPLMS